MWMRASLVLLVFVIVISISIMDAAPVKTAEVGDEEQQSHRMESDAERLKQQKTETAGKGASRQYFCSFNDGGKR
jgi:hypothetical protein